MHERRSKGCEVPFKSPERTTCVLQPRVCVFDCDNLAMHKQPHNTIHASNARAGALVIHRPGLGGSSHRWVPVNTHSTPLPSMNGRLWVAQHQPLAHHKMSRAKNFRQTFSHFFFFYFLTSLLFFALLFFYFSLFFTI